MRRERTTPGLGSGKRCSEAMRSKGLASVDEVSLHDQCCGSGADESSERLEPTRVSPGIVSPKGLSGLKLDDIQGKTLLGLGGFSGG